MEDVTLVQLFAQMDRHLARQDEILDRMDVRGRQHTDAMLQISANMTRVVEILDRSMQRLETQQTQLGEILGGMAGMLGDMAGMLVRMDEHTTMIAQILSQFQQGRNGH